MANPQKWSAKRISDYGYTQVNILNGTHIELKQISDKQVFLSPLLVCSTWLILLHLKNGTILDQILIVQEKHGIRSYIPLPWGPHGCNYRLVPFIFFGINYKSINLRRKRDGDWIQQEADETIITIVGQISAATLIYLGQTNKSNLSWCCSHWCRQRIQIEHVWVTLWTLNHIDQSLGCTVYLIAGYTRSGPGQATRARSLAHRSGLDKLCLGSAMVTDDIVLIHSGD